MSAGQPTDLDRWIRQAAYDGLAERARRLPLQAPNTALDARIAAAARAARQARSVPVLRLPASWARVAALVLLSLGLGLALWRGAGMGSAGASLAAVPEAPAVLRRDQNTTWHDHGTVYRDGRAWRHVRQTEWQTARWQDPVSGADRAVVLPVATDHFTPVFTY